MRQKLGLTPTSSTSARASVFIGYGLKTEACFHSASYFFKNNLLINYKNNKNEKTGISINRSINNAI